MFPLSYLTDRSNRAIYEETISKFNLDGRRFYSNQLWRCFGCMHVKNATVILAIWHLSLHISGLLMIITLLMSPQSFGDLDNDNSVDVQINGTPIQSDLTTDAPLLTANVKQYLCEEQTSDTAELKLWMVLTFMSLMANLMIIYGTVYNRAKYMVPFLCLQMFDFMITLSTVITYTLFVSDTVEIFKPLNKFPIPFQLNTIQMKMVTISVMLFAVFIKMYLLNVVWRCYKFLVMRHIIRLHRLQCVDEEGANFKNDSAASPPSYDDAMKQNANNCGGDVPPPTYSSSV